MGRVADARGDAREHAPRLDGKRTRRDDALLRSWLARSVDPDALCAIEPELAEMGALAAGRLHELALAHRREEPEHVPFDAWGRRIDEVRVNPAWQEYARVAAERGGPPGERVVVMDDFTQGALDELVALTGARVVEVRRMSLREVYFEVLAGREEVQVTA